MRWRQRRHAEYQGGKSLTEVARKYGHDRQCVRMAWRRRGWEIRVSTKKKAAVDPVTFQFLPCPEPTKAEIEAAIGKLKRLMVPPELRLIWRKWSLAERSAVIRKMRKVVPDPEAQPSTPFSSNVMPFDYCSKAAWAIANRENAGYPSRLCPIRLKVGSQGVIYKGRLWFWTMDKLNGGSYYGGPWKEGCGRPCLHRVIYEEHFGKIPASTTVIFKDGNPNNLAPENFALRSRAECALNNSAHQRLKKDPHNKELVAKRDAVVGKVMKARHEQSRKKTEMLLNMHNRGQGSVVAQLK
ncbi:MAG: HNH endonuclease signature motif containing protein [Verrucomicrobiota bacterium]